MEGQTHLTPSLHEVPCAPLANDCCAPIHHGGRKCRTGLMRGERNGLFQYSFSFTLKFQREAKESRTVEIVYTPHGEGIIPEKPVNQFRKLRLFEVSSQRRGRAPPQGDIPLLSFALTPAHIPLHQILCHYLLPKENSTSTVFRPQAGRWILQATVRDENRCFCDKWYHRSVYPPYFEIH